MTPTSTLKIISLIVLALGLGLSLKTTAPVAEKAADKSVPPSREAVQFSFAPIVRQTAPAVVNVYVTKRVQAFNSPFADDPVFRRFFGDRFGDAAPERMQSSLGSGVIINADGIVVTNTHVVKARGETEIRVALSDKREFDAKVIALDDKTDIAVLKIEGGEGRFSSLEFADSDELEVGDMVLAIGNPFGVGQTVTSGIISGLARTGFGQSDRQVFIQTDAAINPGNSGGALVDMSGKLVGINTMIFSKSGGSVGIGFAIPSNLVKLYAEGAVTGKKIEQPWIGAKIETVSREMAEGLGLDRIAGAVVTRVNDKGPAVDAKVEPGDVIVKVDGFEVTDARNVYYRLTTKGIGNTARFDIIRKGQPATADIALVAAPKGGKDDVRNLAGNHPFNGARVSNLLPSVADELSLDEGEGVAIVSIKGGSPAQRLGFRPGDIIVQVGQTKIAIVTDLESALSERQRVWQIAVKRGGRVLTLQVPG